MKKLAIALICLPSLFFAQPSSGGMSLYGSQSQQGPAADCSHLSRNEQAFAAQLSAMHKNVFCQQFSPQQRQDAMSLVKMKDPLNTSPGKITPDHAVEIILQSSRETGLGDNPPQNTQGQQTQQQYQPRNQQRQQGYPYKQNQQQRQNPQQGRSQGSCKQY